MERIMDNIERAVRHAEHRANATQTDETRIMDDLLILIERYLPIEAYMTAENCCTMEDIRERETWGEDGDTVGWLRKQRRDVLDAARELAENLAKVRKTVAEHTTL